MTTGSLSGLPEGALSTACYLTINGAVEQVLVRGARRIRVGLAGPGKAFGTRASSTVCPLRPRRSRGRGRLLLVVPRDLFARLFNGENAVSRGFLDVIQKDQMLTVRETLRPSLASRRACSRRVQPSCCAMACDAPIVARPQRDGFLI